MVSAKLFGVSHLGNLCNFTPKSFVAVAKDSDCG